MARAPIIDLDAYRERLERAARPPRARSCASMIDRARSAPEARIVFPEGEETKILRAAQILVDEGIAQPDPARATASVDPQRAPRELTARLSQPTIIWPHDRRGSRRYVAGAIWAQRQRKGITAGRRAQADVARAQLLRHDDGRRGRRRRRWSPGSRRTIPRRSAPRCRSSALRPGVRRAAGMYMMLKEHDVLFCADTTVNIDPDAETLAEIAMRHRRRRARSRHRAARGDALVLQLRLDASTRAAREGAPRRPRIVEAAATRR